MNAFDYLLGLSKDLDKHFVLNHNETVCFSDIYEGSLKIASYLKDVVGEDQKIVLISQNSVFFILAYLGIIKSGNVCVPVNPAIEQANLDYIAGLTESKMIFVSDSLRSALKIPDVSRIDETKLSEILQSVSVDSAVASVNTNFDGNRLAEILFTSGSTGAPKGVMLSHINICSNTDSIIQYLGLTTSDIVEVVLPFFYCYGLSLLHTHLRVGGSVVFNNNFIFLGSVIDDLNKYKCTGFAGVPSHYQLLLKKSQTFKTSKFPSLRYVTQAGGKLHDVFIEDFVETFPEIKFFIMYGQTEATARLSYLPPERIHDKLGSIGKGIPGVTLKVVNDQNCSVEYGEVGELIVKGNNVMKGYYNDLETTKETIKNGWLYTGDLARVDEDGFIYLVARKKEIIKVGGKRVSPKEIEEVILSVPEVIDCTIEGVYDDLLGEAIKANIVLSKPFDETSIREKIMKKCSECLSLFKIPQIMQFSENLNVNAAGKKVKS